MNTIKTCSLCSLEKIAEKDFHKNSGNRDGYQYYCKLGVKALGKGEIKPKIKDPDEPRVTRVDIVGKVFGRLTVLERLRKKNKRGRWVYDCRCLCECGRETTVSYFNLTNSTGGTRSCGCGRSEACRKREFRKNHPTHGTVLSYYKKNAKDRNLSWSLSLEDFTSLIRGNCIYCGDVPEKRVLTGKEIEFNGIDRIDSSRGYFSNNVVSCCTNCNMAKRTRNYENFLNWADRISIRKMEILAYVKSVLNK